MSDSDNIMCGMDTSVLAKVGLDQLMPFFAETLWGEFQDAGQQAKQPTFEIGHMIECGSCTVLCYVDCTQLYCNGPYILHFRMGGVSGPGYAPAKGQVFLSMTYGEEGLRYSVARNNPYYQTLAWKALKGLIVKLRDEIEVFEHYCRCYRIIRIELL